MHSDNQAAQTEAGAETTAQETAAVRGNEDEAAAAEVAALTGLAQWINCQGDSEETADLMDQLEEKLPGKVERGSGLS